MKTFDLYEQDDARSVFDYVDGALLWKIREDCPKHWNTKFGGKSAGSPKADGYFKVKQSGRFYCRSRIVWVFHFGAIDGPLQVDHINRNTSDDRIENLRLATGSENCRNMQSRDSISGCRGVSVVPGGRFKARITLEGNLLQLGTYESQEKAAEAYADAAKKLHGEFSILCSKRVSQ